MRIPTWALRLGQVGSVAWGRCCPLLITALISAVKIPGCFLLLIQTSLNGIGQPGGWLLFHCDPYLGDLLLVYFLSCENEDKAAPCKGVKRLSQELVFNHKSIHIVTSAFWVSIVSIGGFSEHPLRRSTSFSFWFYWPFSSVDGPSIPELSHITWR